MPDTSYPNSKQIIKSYQKVNIKIIGKELEIETPITTYVARHTYATILKRNGVLTSIISNALGLVFSAIVCFNLPIINTLSIT